MARAPAKLLPNAALLANLSWWSQRMIDRYTKSGPEAASSLFSSVSRLQKLSVPTKKDPNAALCIPVYSMGSRERRGISILDCSSS